MMADLRTRIAKVLSDADGMPWDMWSKPAQDGYLLRADAVIRELGLHREIEVTWDNNRSRETGHRYVTDWKADE